MPQQDHDPPDLSILTPTALYRWAGAIRNRLLATLYAQTKVETGTRREKPRPACRRCFGSVPRPPREQPHTLSQTLPQRRVAERSWPDRVSSFSDTRAIARHQPAMRALHTRARSPTRLMLVMSQRLGLWLLLASSFILSNKRDWRVEPRSRGTSWTVWRNPRSRDSIYRRFPQ